MVFDELKAVGFDEDQALDLTIAAMRAGAGS